MGLEYTAEAGSVPTLSLEERDRRYQAIRDRMVEQNFDCLLVWGDSRIWDWGTANIRYLTQIGGNAEEGFVVFPLNSAPRAITWNELMAPSWRKFQDWVEVKGRGKSGEYPKMIGETLSKNNSAGKKIGLVGDPPISIMNDLREVLSSYKVEDADGIIEGIRATKSEEEIRFLSKAAKIADSTIKTYVDMAEIGVTERELVAEMHKTMTEEGGEPPYMLILSSGNPPLPHPYRLPTDRKLQKGDTIHAEFHPKYGGYVVHKARSIVLGDIGARQQKMIDVGKDALNSGMEAMTPGTSIPDIERALRTPVLNSEFSWREGKVSGHGLTSGELPKGSLVDSPPQSIEDTPTAPPYELKKNMVISIQLNMANKEWTEGAMMIDDTFLITEDGPERFGEYEFGPIQNI